jgi:methyl-accepting chemotaxis protein
MKTHASLRTKTVLAFTLVSSFLLVTGGLSLYFQKRIVSDYNSVATVNLPNMATLGEMKADALTYAADVAYLTKETASPEQRAKYRKEVDNDLKAYENSDKTYNSIPFMEGEEQIYNPVNESWKRVTEIGNKIVALNATNQDPKVHNEQEQLYEGSFTQEIDKYVENFSKLKQFHSTAGANGTARAEKSAQWSQFAAILLMVSGFGTAMLVGFLFSTSIAKSLSELAQRLSQGADEIASASQQLSNSSTELSSTTTEQAASLQETTASMEEISAMIQKNSENATSSRTLSAESRKSADEGRHVVTEMIQAIQEIDQSNSQIMNQVEASNREIAAIIQVIEEIGSKTKVINDIVFQTKLLSFNASVEAARAGEHGKGFAVVAEEVGNLAQMSGKAAKEIGDLLSGSIQKVHSIVNDTKTKVESLIAHGKEKVEAGSNVAKRCEQVLGELLKNVASVDQMVSEIANASQEQSQGVSEVGRAIAQLDEATQQNASVSQQTASASNQLSGQAHQLNQVVQDLVSLIQGQGKYVAQAPAAPVVKAPVKQTGPSTQTSKKSVPSSDHKDFSEPTAA